ncbi:hypothetical protein ABPG75_013826 [Micractinium tetrahymenae]
MKRRGKAHGALACQLAETGQRLAGAEAERDQLRSMLDAERGTAFVSLNQFQKQQEDAGVRAVRAETELRALQERYAEEKAGCDALKKMMVFYQHATGDSGALAGDAAGSSRSPVLRGMDRPELKYAETLQDVDDLLMREADPTGERYALSKVLHTLQGDLHAIFLYYCMLDSGFARFWPPQLTLNGWLAFMKEIGSTNLVPGTRTRSEATLHVQEATEVFRKYCLRQAVMRGAGPLALHAPSTVRTESTLMAAASAVREAAGPPRPPSGQSTASAALTARPFSAATASQLASATMSFQAFCAALVHVAAKVARSSPEAMEACPFLSEQTRAFIEQVVPKAQRVAPLAVSSKKGAATTGGAGGKAAPAPSSGGLGAKDAAAKEAAAKLPKLKKAKASSSKAGGASGGGGGSPAGQEMAAIAEASREGSAAAVRG